MSTYSIQYSTRQILNPHRRISVNLLLRSITSSSHYHHKFPSPSLQVAQTRTYAFTVLPPLSAGTHVRAEYH